MSKAIERQIEADLIWREEELNSLKLLAVRESRDKSKMTTILRAMTAMLYAHYEGFSKFCWELFIAEVAKVQPLTRELTNELKATVLKSELRKLRNSSTDLQIVEYLIQYDSSSRMRQSNFGTVKVETESNLWPHTFRKLSEQLGLDDSYVAKYETSIKSLVGQRNGIAHGEKLLVDQIEKYETLEKDAFLIMHELAISTMQSLADKHYLLERYRK
jgi:hypothetical protein